ncbi:TPR repeat-containing thioredoxin TTL1 [Cajanus cajan]|uniref:DnaJ isogeny subfamily C member 7 n=1 Tax=Cajanus cajan TaxID=3821 RepID=A0A151SDC1_CAJCA|nr:TPR repeat-containing thioredoxin TTL1 [Cajanus cajan]KYP52835.1 DnaJ isogeny subfamily C member 7 [Cajanus cajan]
MAAKAKNKVQIELGCGLLGRIFHLKTNNRPRKSSVHSLPVKACNTAQQRDQAKAESKTPPNHESKVPRDSTTSRKTTSSNRAPSAHRNTPNGRPSDAARTSIQQSHDSNDESKQQKEQALELARINTGTNQQQYNETKSPAKEFVLPITGNLLVNSSPRTSVTKSKELNFMSSSCSYNNKGVMGNIMRKNSDEVTQFRSPRNNRVDPEVLKSMGNEAYKQGRFEEALALYDRAIALDSNKATYHCNKSAALIGLGRFLQAIVECEEAIRLEPSYERAHTRLATIYLRLGETEKALNCNETTPYVDSVLAFQTQALGNHLSKCTEARKVKDWKTVLKETQAAISLGADSAPLVYSLQTEALLKLLRHQEAYATYEKMPKFDLNCCNKLFGPARSAYLLMIGAQIYLAAGRFEEAVTSSQQAAKLDPSNSEVNAVVRRARAVASARMSGNLLFKASKFMEACAVYNEGLEHDPYNSVLLCNRAACRSKLGQFEKAIEDCNVALLVQPSYSKARLRRADCNAKLERWEVAIQDYEMLLREKPGDEEVARALFETQLQLKMLRGEDIKDLKFGSNLVLISSNDRFRHYVTSPGMSVVLFCNKATHKQVLLVLEQTCKRFPSVNFLKVEIEDHPYLAKSEGVNSIPAFKIYKNGSRVKEIPGNNHDLLEKLVKLYIR